MGILSIIILGIVQGIAEFLPISSSAHLIIFRDIFGVGTGIESNVALAFDIALHFGTLLAICVAFFKDFLNMVMKGFSKGPKHKEGKLMWQIIVATIPAAIFGVLLEEIIENKLRKEYILIALALMVMGIIIYVIDRKSKQEKGIEEMSFKDALMIGCAQIFALIPGFSRSGTTIAAGRALRLKREDAAKFSFYLSAPVVLGATTLTILKPGMLSLIGSHLSIFMIGILVSFMVGLLCIEFLLKYLKRHDFGIFMWYRIAIALIVIGYVLFH